jgi:hypothetical protein
MLRTAITEETEVKAEELMTETGATYIEAYIMILGDCTLDEARRAIKKVKMYKRIYGRLSSEIQSIKRRSLT